MARLLKKARHRLFKSRSTFFLSVSSRIPFFDACMESAATSSLEKSGNLACILLYLKGVAVPDRTAWPQGPQVTEEDQQRRKEGPAMKTMKRLLMVAAMSAVMAAGA